MSEEVNINEKIVSAGKIFTDRKLWLGSILGGPLMAGYIIYKNYKVFKEYDKANKVIIITILFTVILFIIIFSMPDNIKIPKQIIPILYTSIAWGFLKKYQGDKIERYKNNGGELIGWGKTLLISILVLIITVISIFGVIILLKIIK